MGLILSILVLVLFVPAIGQEGAEDANQAVNPSDFEALKTRVSQLEEKLNNLTAENEGLRGIISSTQESVDSVEKNQSEIQETLSGLEDTVKNQGNQLEKISDLSERINNLENKVKKLVAELGSLNQKNSSNKEQLSQLEGKYNSAFGDISDLKGDLNDFESSLTKLRERTFDNEKKLANLQETYRASARRNLLVAASGIVVGLVGLTLFWAS